MRPESTTYSVVAPLGTVAVEAGGAGPATGQRLGRQAPSSDGAVELHAQRVRRALVAPW